MTTEIVMRRNGQRLEPVDQMSADDLATVPLGKDLLVTVKAPRNLKQLRFAWALAQKISEARDDLPDKDAAMDALCELSRHVKFVVSPITQHMFITRKSISNLDGAAFSRLLNRMVYVTCATILPGLKESVLRAEIEAMVTGEPRQRRAA